MTAVHNCLLEKLSDFNDKAMAWLNECAPDYLHEALMKKANSEDTDEIKDAEHIPTETDAKPFTTGNETKDNDETVVSMINLFAVK